MEWSDPDCTTDEPATDQPTRSDYGKERCSEGSTCCSGETNLQKKESTKWMDLGEIGGDGRNDLDQNWMVHHHGSEHLRGERSGQRPKVQKDFRGPWMEEFLAGSMRRSQPLLGLDQGLSRKTRWEPRLVESWLYYMLYLP